MVVIARNITVIATYNFAWSFAKGVPNAHAATIFLCRAFDLVASSCCSPKEVIWKNIRHKL
jgi:hypothetical protein